LECMCKGTKNKTQQTPMPVERWTAFICGIIVEYHTRWTWVPTPRDKYSHYLQECDPSPNYTGCY
jgi:hypothetical protein